MSDLAAQLEAPAEAGDVTRDWLVWFAHKVASEDERRARLPGSSWCLMLREDEAHGLVAQVNELVQRESKYS